MARDNGGPAFPIMAGGALEDGMSLRDYFAAHASYEDLQKWIGLGWTMQAARYAHADEMIKVRSK